MDREYKMKKVRTNQNDYEYFISVCNYEIYRRVFSVLNKATFYKYVAVDKKGRFGLERNTCYEAVIEIETKYKQIPKYN